MQTSRRLPTSLIAASGLVAGFAVAQATGVRPLGGVFLAAAGVWCGVTWYQRHGIPTTAALSAVYLGSFVGSHSLAKLIGAWPSVGVVAATTAVAAHLLSDAKAARELPAHDA